MALALIARNPDGTVRLLAKDPFTAARYALVRLEVLAADPASDLRDAEIFLVDLETAQPVLVVWPSATPEVAEKLAQAASEAPCEATEVTEVVAEGAVAAEEPRGAILPTNSDLFVIDSNGGSFGEAAASLRALIASVVEEMRAAPAVESAENTGSCVECVFTETCPDSGLKSPEDCETFQRR